jgi:hypothetical protein
MMAASALTVTSQLKAERKGKWECFITTHVGKKKLFPEPS